MGPGGARRGPWTWVAGVLLAGALLRLLAATVLVPAWEARTRRAAFPDLYPTLAASLVDRAALGFAPLGASITTARGPAFPAWLAVPMLGGLRGDRVLAWWASLPGLLGALLAAWATARFRGGRPLGLAIAAALAALHPLPVFASARGMADEFCGVLGLTGLVGWRVAEASHGRRRILWACASGLALGLAMLTRATGALFVVAMLGIAVLSSRAALRRAILVACLALIPALAWSIRSSRLECRPVFVHSLAAYNFWLGEAQNRFGFAPDPGRGRARADDLMAREADIPAAQASTLWYRRTPRETAQLEEALTRAAMARVTGDPWGYAGRVVRGLVRFWIGAETRSTARAYAAVVLPFLALLVAGALSSFRFPRDPLPLALVLAIALHALFYAAVYPMARYSVAVYPCAALLIGLAYSRMGSAPPP